MCLPTIFAYDDCNAGCRRGNTLSPQLIQPRMHCHSTSGLLRDSAMLMNARMAVISLSHDSSDIDIIMVCGSTYRPIISRVGPKSCFDLACGRPRSSYKSRRVTCLAG